MRLAVSSCSASVQRGSITGLVPCLRVTSVYYISFLLPLSLWLSRLDPGVRLQLRRYVLFFCSLPMAIWSLEWNNSAHHEAQGLISIIVRWMSHIPGTRWGTGGSRRIEDGAAGPKSHLLRVWDREQVALMPLVNNKVGDEGTAGRDKAVADGKAQVDSLLKVSPIWFVFF